LRFVVDTSALVAIVNGEPEAGRFHGLLLDHESVISCGTLIETLRVMQVGLGNPALEAIDRLIALYGIEPVPSTPSRPRSPARVCSPTARGEARRPRP
jgi:uncharacterized protein with PIN domain